jgi:hypothetical protein
MTISGAPTSYFSTPESQLDPTLFQGRVLRSWVRTGILALLSDFLNQTYRHSDLWAHAWLAGSGVSYQWSAARQPGDLDCLVGVDFVQFRKANPEYQGLSDTEISEQINEQFREKLHPKTANWNGYELTFYVNPGASDIRAINPYAAYDLKFDEWTVTPSPMSAPNKPEWEEVANKDAQKTGEIVKRFTISMNEIQNALNPAQRRNAEIKLSSAAQQGLALYEEIHGNRSQAFSRNGQGYADFHNYRWQAGKRLGTVNSLRNIKEHFSKNAPNYGVELPNTSTLIRRAALYGNYPV